MKIYVKDISGRTLELYADSWDTIENIKSKIQDEKGYVSDQIILTFNSVILNNEYKLEYYNIM